MLNTESHEALEITHDLQDTPQPGIEQISVESETGTPVENAEIYINGQNQGQTGESGTANVEIPQEEFNLRIEHEDQEITSQHQAADYENHGIQINEEELNPGDQITIRVFYQDRHLSEGEVLINDRSIGETNSIGRIETTVPEEESINIEVPDSGLTKQRTINFEERESDDTEEDTDEINQTQLQTQIDTENVQIGDTRTLTVENTENQPQADVEIELNNQSIGQTDEEGQINVEFQQAGENSLEILLEDQESIEEIIDVEESEEEQELEIRTLNQPVQGEEIQFEFIYDNESVEAEFFIDGESRGTHQNYTYTLDDEITVEATYEEMVDIDLITPVSEFEISKNSPNSDETYNQNEILAYDFEIDEIKSTEANYTLELEHTEINQDLDRGQTTMSHEENASETINLTIETPNLRTKFEEQLQIIEGDTENQPIFTLQSPTDELETFEDQKEVTFEYHVQDTGWADIATIEIEDEDYEDQRQVSSGITYTDFQFELPSSEESIEYSWIITLEDEEEDNTKQKEATFELTKIEPNADLELVDEVEEGDGEVEFNYFAESDVEANIEIEVVAEEDMSRTWMQCDGLGNLEERNVDYDEGDVVAEFDIDIFGDQEFDAEFTELLVVEGDYSWNGEIFSEEYEALLDSSGPQIFTLTDQPEDDTEEDCDGEDGG